MQALCLTSFLIVFPTCSQQLPSINRPVSNARYDNHDKPPPSCDHIYSLHVSLSLSMNVMFVRRWLNCNQINRNFCFSILTTGQCHFHWTRGVCWNITQAIRRTHAVYASSLRLAKLRRLDQLAKLAQNRVQRHQICCFEVELMFIQMYSANSFESV